MRLMGLRGSVFISLSLVIAVVQTNNLLCAIVAVWPITKVSRVWVLAKDACIRSCLTLIL